MEIIEPGTLDLEKTNVRIGGLKFGGREQLEQGVKCVIAEHFVDPEGNPIDEQIFDATRMCYSLFVSPIPRTGAHKDVLRSHRDVIGRIGRIVGGAFQQIPTNNTVFEFVSSSGDFGAEPGSVRKRLAALELPLVEKQLGVSFLKTRIQEIPPWSLNVYWMRYRQVLQAFEDNFANDRETLADKKRSYRAKETEFMNATHQT